MICIYLFEKLDTRFMNHGRQRVGSCVIPGQKPEVTRTMTIKCCPTSEI